MPLALSGHCPVCHSKDKLLRCQGCKSVPYCGRQHQESHRKEHKSICNAIKKARTKLENEERKLRAMPGDMVSECAKFERISDSLQLTPPGATIFEDNVGHFWGIHETRHYMRSRYGTDLQPWQRRSLSLLWQTGQCPDRARGILYVYFFLSGGRLGGDVTGMGPTLHVALCGLRLDLEALFTSLYRDVPVKRKSLQTETRPL